MIFMAKTKTSMKNKQRNEIIMVINYLIIVMLGMVIVAPFKPWYFLSAGMIFGLMMMLVVYSDILKEEED